MNRISYPWVKADPEIIMNKEDVEKAYKVAPQAKIITVHMDAINHMTVTRKDMKKFVEAKRPRLPRAHSAGRRGDCYRFRKELNLYEDGRGSSVFSSGFGKSKKAPSGANLLANCS